MITPQRLPASLTPLDTVLAAWLRDLKPVAAIEVAPSEALYAVAAEMPSLAAVPARDVAAVDGWALRSSDLVGASSYTPLPLNAPPAWVEAGEPMPDFCDCVLDQDSVDRTSPIVQVLAEAVPGQGVRRKSSDIAEASLIAAPGERLSARDLLLARMAGLARLSVRRPRVSIVNLPGGTATANLIVESAREAGADVSFATAAARDVPSIANALDPGAGDFLLVIGGSGVGQTDASVVALARRGEIIAHGLALQPGRTTAAGRIDATPVIVLPGAPDQALAAWWTLALPALDRLSGRPVRPTITRPLARKIASLVGVAEIVLLDEEDGAWLPLAIGELSLAVIARAKAWLLVPGGSEGYALGTPVDAYMLPT
jgi:molybdopterin molybdotransferase